MDDVLFSYNGGNRPESKTMFMFRPVCQVAALGVKSASPTASCYYYNYIIIVIIIIMHFCLTVSEPLSGGVA